MLAIREWGKGWCVIMSCVRLVWWCVIVSVCACHLSVCVSVCMWVPDLGLNPDSDTEKCMGCVCGGGTSECWKSRNAEMRTVWLRWEVKGSERAGLMAGSASYVSSAKGFWRQALEQKEKLSLLVVLSPGWLSPLQNKRMADGGCVRVTWRDLMGLITILSETYLKLFRERHYIPWEPSLILIVYLLIKWQSKTMLMGKITISPLSISIPHVDRPRTYLKLHVKALMWSLTIS